MEQLSSLAWDIAHLPADVEPMQCVFLLQHMPYYFIRVGVDSLDGNQIARIMWSMARRIPMGQLQTSPLGERAVSDLFLFLVEHLLNKQSKLSAPLTFSYSLARMVWAVARIHHWNERFMHAFSRPFHKQSIQRSVVGI